MGMSEINRKSDIGPTTLTRFGSSATSFAVTHNPVIEGLKVRLAAMLTRLKLTAVRDRLNGFVDEAGRQKLSPVARARIARKPLTRFSAMEGALLGVLVFG